MFKRFSYYMLATIIPQIVALGTLPIFTRQLTPSDYGVIALFLMYGTVIVGFVSLGIRAASYKYYFEMDKESFGKLNFTNLVFLFFVFLITGVAGYYAAPLVSEKVFDSKISAFYLNLSFLYACFDFLLSYYSLFLVAEKRSKAFAFFVLLRVICDNAVSLILIFAFGMTLEGKIYGSIIGVLIPSLVVIFYLRHLITPKIQFIFLKKSIYLGAPSVLGGLTGVINTSFDRGMLANFGKLQGLSDYHFGLRFGGIFQAFHHTIQRIWSPFFFEKIQDAGNFSHITKRFHLMVLSLGIVAVSICLFSEELLLILVSSEFYGAKYVIPLVVLALFISTLNEISIGQLTYKERLIFQFPVALVGDFTNIGLNLVAIPMYGAAGAAGATLCSSIITSCLYFYFGQKVCPLPFSWKSLVGLLGFIFLCSSLSYGFFDLDMNGWYKFGLKLCLFSTICVLGIRFVGHDDLHIIKSKFEGMLLKWRPGQTR